MSQLSSLEESYDPTGPIPFPKVDTPKSLVQNIQISKKLSKLLKDETIHSLIQNNATFDLDDKGEVLSYIIPQNIYAHNVYFDIETTKKNIQSILDKYGIVCQNVDSIQVSVDEKNPNLHKITIEKYIFQDTI